LAELTAYTGLLAIFLSAVNYVVDFVSQSRLQLNQVPAIVARVHSCLRAEMEANNQVLRAELKLTTRC
jgi:predicted transcriptional regulator